MEHFSKTTYVGGLHELHSKEGPACPAGEFLNHNVGYLPSNK